MIAICEIYFSIELCQTFFQKIEADEFWFAHHIAQYLDKIPYRDFLPYKSVLGYYLFTPPFFFLHHVFYTLWLTKIEFLIINTVCLCYAGIWLTRYYRPDIIFFTFLIVIFNESFLVYSTSLRPEVLICWLGLFSILCILDYKIVWAAIFVGIAFLISQKAIWYIVACDMAIVCSIFFRGYFYSTIRHVVIFNLIIAMIVVTYLAIWSSITSWQTLFDSFFYEAYVLAKINYYHSALYYGWQIVLSKVSFLFLMWPLIWLGLLGVPLKNHIKRLRIAVFASMVLACIVLYQQPFAYNMFFAFPAFFIVYPELFSFLYQYPFENHTRQQAQFLFLFLYAIILMGMMIVFSLPIIVFLVVITVAIGFYFYFVKQKNELYTKVVAKIILTAIIISGVIYSLIAYILTLPLLDNSYQKYNLELANELLSEKDGYIAGTPFIYDHNQPIHGMINLIAPAVEYLQRPSLDLLPLLNPSLDLVATNTQHIIEQMESHPVKLFIDNYRLHEIPNPLKAYLSTHFYHYSGSIFLYALPVPSGLQEINLSFTGSYAVTCKTNDCSENGRILIDSVQHRIGSIVNLTAGKHISDSETHYSLNFIPVGEHTLEEYKKDDFSEMNKSVYM